MKKLLFIPLIALLASCATYKPVYHVEQPTITLADSNLCVSGGLSATINHDSLFYFFDKGVVLGDKGNNVKIYYQTNGSDPLNGQIVVESHLCLSGSDFCLTGQYWIQVPKNDFYAKLQAGLNFGTQAASVYVIYSNGKLTLSPKICIKTKK